MDVLTVYLRLLLVAMASQAFMGDFGEGGWKLMVSVDTTYGWCVTKQLEVCVCGCGGSTSST